MTTPQRIVQRVRLRADSESLVRRGALLLEDALRTAATPLAGRVLVVRSLAVGSIRAGSSPTAVARSVEERLREVATSAPHAVAAGAASAPAVYFRNDAEPLLLLAIRLASGASSDEWFWPIAVQVWHPGMPRDDALRAIAYAASVHPAAPATLAAIVGELTTRGTVDALLSVVRHGDVAPLLRGCAIADLSRALPDHFSTMHARAPSDRRDAPLTPTAMRVVERWGGGAHWGWSDARTAWLSAMLLIAERRSLAGAADLPRRIREVIVEATADRRVLYGQPAQTSDSPSAVDRLVSTEIHVEERRKPRPRVGSTDRQARIIAHLGDTEQSPVTESKIERDVDVEQRTTAQSVSRPAAPVNGDDGKSTDVEVPLSSPSRKSTPRRAGRKTSRAEAPSRTEARSAGRDVRSSMRDPRTVASDVEQQLRFSGGDLATEHAGFFFLIPAMMRLGMGTFLESQPALLAADFATRVLRDIAARLAIPSTDAVWQALDLTPDPFPPEAWRGNFVVPEIWRELVAAPASWAVCPGQGGSRVLTDGTPHLVLARWQRRWNREVKSLVGDTRLHDGAPVPGSAGEILLQSWRFAIRRYCRRATGLTIKAIVTRSGRIAVARTHLDVFFTMRDVDIRIRRAGLDSDPQWLPWLGRVVQFHFEPERSRDVR